MKDSDFHIELLIDISQAPYRLLELADPSKKSIDKYLYKGECYIATQDKKLIGVIILQAKTINNIEIKNIAIAPEHQGKGFGKHLLRFATRQSKRKGYKKLIIGTGNSSLSQLALYQKEGFEIREVNKDYFLEKYPQKLYENGIQCKHQLVLEKNL